MIVKKVTVGSFPQAMNILLDYQEDMETVFEDILSNIQYVLYWMLCFGLL